MRKLHKNKYYIAFIISLCIFFAAILSLHSYYNLQSIIQPPSDNWGRSTSLEAEDLFKKQPSIRVNDEYADILVANKSNFTHLKINRATREVQNEVFSLNTVESYKLQKFDWDENNIYFIEGNSLFYSAKNPTGGYADKTKLSDEVVDFDIVYTKEGLFMIVAHKDGILVYRQSGKDFILNENKFAIENVLGLSAIKDREGAIHIAAYGESSSIENPVYYLKLQDDKFTLEASAIEKSISETWSISNIELGIDDQDAYIFYEMIKRDKFGIGAKVHYAYRPLNSESTELTFSRFFLTEEDAKNPNSFLSEVRVLETQEDQVKLTMVKDTYDKKSLDGFSGYHVTMENNAVESIKRITRNHPLIVDTASQYINGDNVFVYMNASGGFNYEAFYTESGDKYFENALKPRQADYMTAIMEAIPGYVSSLLVSLIKLTVFFPVIIWFLIIEFFEIKRLRDKQTLCYSIGLLLYMIIKVATFNTYYTALSITQMPPMLMFTGAKYFYSIGIALVSLLIQKLLKKHNPEMHLITEFIIFSLIDIEFTNLLYATYMT